MIVAVAILSTSCELSAPTHDESLDDILAVDPDSDIFLTIGYAEGAMKERDERKFKLRTIYKREMFGREDDECAEILYAHGMRALERNELKTAKMIFFNTILFNPTHPGAMRRLRAFYEQDGLSRKEIDRIFYLLKHRS